MEIERSWRASAGSHRIVSTNVKMQNKNYAGTPPGIGVARTAAQPGESEPRVSTLKGLNIRQYMLYFFHN